MPLLKLETSVPLTGAKQKDVLAALSRAVSSVIGKPEQYVMVTAAPAAIRMSGSDEPAAFVDARSIGGLGGDVNRRLSEQVCEILQQSLGILPERVYLNFTDAKPANWGWNGSTFG